MCRSPPCRSPSTASSTGAPLPAPGPRRPAADGTRHPLRTPAERLVAAAWTTSWTPTCRRRRRLFALGGDSILAVRVTFPAARLGTDVSPRLLSPPTPPCPPSRPRWPNRAGTRPARSSPRRPGTAVVRPATPVVPRPPGSTEYTTPNRAGGCAGLARHRRRPAPPWTLLARHASPRIHVLPNTRRSQARWSVHPPRPADLPVDDLADTAALDALLDREAATPFDLTSPGRRSGPGWPGSAPRSTSSSWPRTTSSPTAGPPASRPGTWASCYTAAREERRPDLPEPPIRYTDYAKSSAPAPSSTRADFAYWCGKRWTGDSAGAADRPAPSGRPHP